MLRTNRHVSCLGLATSSSRDVAAQNLCRDMCDSFPCPYFVVVQSNVLPSLSIIILVHAEPRALQRCLLSLAGAALDTAHVIALELRVEARPGDLPAATEALASAASVMAQEAQWPYGPSSVVSAG